MKAIFTSILAIICVVILILGNIHWGNKTEIKAENNTASASETPPVNENTEEDIEQADPSQLEELLSLATNWPEESQVQLQEALEAKKPFKILFVGSDSLGEGENSWPSILEQRLTEAYGGIFTFNTFIYDLNTKEFIEENKQEELAKEKADLILFEPLVLRDNGEVVIETSLEYIGTIMDDVKSKKPTTTFILQPPHPIYNAGFYNVQVGALQDYAEGNGIPYLNHWEAWPETTSTEIQEYLVTNPSGPNEKGHELWAEHLAKYFIAE